MDKDLAQVVINSASRAANELANLAPLLKEYGGSELDEPVKLAIGSAVYEISLISERVFRQYPDLKGASEARLNKYGRSYY